MDVKAELERMRREITDLKDQLNRVRSPRAINNPSYLIPFLFRSGQQTENRGRVNKGDPFAPDVLRGIPCVSVNSDPVRYAPLYPEPDPLPKVYTSLNLAFFADHGDPLGDYDWYGLCMIDPWERFWLVMPPYRTVEHAVLSLGTIPQGGAGFPGLQWPTVPISAPQFAKTSGRFLSGQECD